MQRIGEGLQQNVISFQKREFPLLDLPIELVLHILLMTRPIELARLNLASRKYKLFFEQTSFWKMFHARYFPRISIKEDLYLDFQQITVFASALSKREGLDLLYQKQFNYRLLQFIHFTADALFIGNTFVFQIDLTTCQEMQLPFEDAFAIRCIAVADDNLYATGDYNSSIFSYDLKDEYKKSTLNNNEGEEVNDLTVFEHFLFAKKLHRLICINLQNRETAQLFSSKRYTLFGSISFFNNYFFISYTNEKEQFGFLAKNFKTNERVKLLCVSINDRRGFSGYYEIHGQLLFLKFNDGTIQYFNMVTCFSGSFKQDSQYKVIQIIKSLHSYSFIRLDGDNFLSVCDEEKKEIFTHSKSSFRAKCICFYKGHLVLGLHSGLIEIWEMYQNKLLFQFEPFANAGYNNLITSLKIVQNRLIVTSLLGQLKIYAFDF